MSETQRGEYMQTCNHCGKDIPKGHCYSCYGIPPHEKPMTDQQPRESRTPEQVLEYCKQMEFSSTPCPPDLSAMARRVMECDETIKTLVKVAAELGAERDKLAAQVEELRKLIWLRHGCPTSALYGDDGEMQCGHCMIDFKRRPLQDILNHFEPWPISVIDERDALRKALATEPEEGANG